MEEIKAKIEKNRLVKRFTKKGIPYAIYENICHSLGKDFKYYELFWFDEEYVMRKDFAVSPGFDPIVYAKKIIK